MVLSSPAQADFELTRPDGRRVLLKDDGTWQYLESTDKNRAPESDKAEAVLRLERKVEGDSGCRLAISLANNLPYEIRSFVPQFSAYRTNGVLYETVFARSAFALLKPGDTQRREVQFTSIACKDIARVEVGGGDRCDMGDLNKWSPANGQCFRRVRVVASDLVRFDK